MRDDSGDGTAGPRAGDRNGASAVIRAGFIPLVDSAALVVASRCGFAAAEGLTIELFRQMSWASLRDRLAVGQFDVAHILAPMPIAANLGVGGLGTPTVVPMALGLGGNAVTVSAGLWSEIAAEGGVLGGDLAGLGAALRRVVRRREQPLTLAMVHPFSAHNYELRYFLAASGIDPDQETRLVVVPPPMMAAALASGQIDGFCAGEPWNSLSVESGEGVILTACSDIRSPSPCKVLGWRKEAVEERPERVAALIRAVDRAAAWADDPANHDRLAELLSAPDLVNVDARLIKRALSGRLVLARGTEPVERPGFLSFRRDGAGRPRPGDAAWFYSQMRRWGQVEASPAAAAAAVATYRPDLYAAALGLPADTGTTGVTGRFFDGGVFDPDEVTGPAASGTAPER